MSMKEHLSSIAELTLKMLSLCVKGFGLLGIGKKDYTKIKNLAKEILKLTEELP